MRDSLQVCDIAKLVGVSESASKQSGVFFVVTVENIEAVKTERIVGGSRALVAKAKLN